MKSDPRPPDPARDPRGTQASDSHDPPLDRRELELAALYALAALPPAEMDAVERDYRERTSFWREVRSLKDAAGELAESGPRARPRRDLWPAIQERVRASTMRAGSSTTCAAQVWKSWSTASASDWLVRAGDGGFEPTGFDGIDVRRLFVDDEHDRVTMLIKMAPGTSYPSHRHGGPEECFVLEGDLSIGDALEMHAGDFQRMDQDSVHEMQSTRGGCLLLVTSSKRDELLG